MSRIGKEPVTLADGVSCTVDGQKVTVDGDCYRLVLSGPPHFGDRLQRFVDGPQRSRADRALILALRFSGEEAGILITAFLLGNVNGCGVSGSEHSVPPYFETGAASRVFQLSKKL